MSPKKPDEDGLAIPRTISADDLRTSTGSHRSLSSSDVDQLIKAQTAAAAKAAARQSEVEVIDDLRLLAVELVGRDGDGGRLEAMDKRIAATEEKLDAHGTLIQQLVEFRAKAVFVAGILVTAGGALAAIAGHLIDRALK